MFDTLTQIYLIRGHYDTASDYLGRASDAYGAYGRQTRDWYKWSVRVLGARLEVIYPVVRHRARARRDGAWRE